MKIKGRKEADILYFFFSLLHSLLYCNLKIRDAFILKNCDNEVDAKDIVTFLFCLCFRRRKLYHESGPLFILNNVIKCHTFHAYWIR